MVTGDVLSVVLIVAVLAAAAAVFFRMSRLPAEIAMPISSAVATLTSPVATAGTQIAQAAGRVDAASKAMEQATSALRTTTGDLSERHQELAAVVTTVNGDGSLGEWVATLQRTVEPIVSTSSALTEHFDTTRTLVRTTGELVTEWAEQRKATESSLTRLTDTMVAWAADDSSHAGVIEQRILQRLQEVSAVDARVADGLSRLQTSQSRLEDAQKSMSETLRQTLDDNRSLLKAMSETLLEHRNAQQRFNNLQAQLQERVVAFQKQSETMLANTQKSVDAMVAGVERSVTTIEEDLRRAHNANETSVKTVVARQAELAGAQEHYVKQQQSLLAQFSQHLALLPSQKFQLAGIWILAANTLLLAVVAVTYVLRHA